VYKRYVIVIKRHAATWDLKTHGLLLFLVYPPPASHTISLNETKDILTLAKTHTRIILERAEIEPT